MKQYDLLGPSGIYKSDAKGTLGGHRGTKVYGSLSCVAAKRALERGGYKKHRVFFADEATAVACGYRPCSTCMREAYVAWKSQRVVPDVDAEAIVPRVPITAEDSLTVWRADGWTCRYCDELVFFPPALRAMARRYGNHGYFHPNWKTSEAPLLIKRGASVDHVVPITRGGAHERSNMVTACWSCNVRKNNTEVWTPKTARPSTTWDGLLAVFVGLAKSGADDAERRWLSAIETSTRQT